MAYFSEGEKSATRETELKQLLSIIRGASIRGRSLGQRNRVEAVRRKNSEKEGGSKCTHGIESEGGRG